VLTRLLNWRPRTPFYYGWLILGITSLATFCATGVSQVVLGGIQVYITDDTGWDPSTLSYAATAGTWCSGLIAPLIGRLADRYGPRWLMPVGLLIAGVCYLMLSGVSAVWQFYLAYVVVRAVSNSVLIGLVPRTAAVNFFRRRRNIALAMVSTFRPIAGAINIQLFALIALTQTWREVFRYLGIFGFALIIPVILLMRRRPEDIGLLPDGAGASPATQPSPGGRGSPVPIPSPETSWTVREATRTRTYWLIVATACVGTLASSSVGFSMVPYLVEGAGLSVAAAAGVLSFGTVLSIANVGWGVLSDHFTPRRCLMVTMVGSGALLGYLTMVDSLTEALVFALVWGVFSGAVGSMENMMLAQYYGRESYGSLLGMLAPFQTAALGLGPSLSSMLRSFSGSYDMQYFVMVAAYFASAALLYFAHAPLRTRIAEAGGELS
jgi:sugar phosphate permease